MADKETLRKNITEILEEADLNTITAKKVRQQLETKLDTNLASRKKEIDDIVMEILEEKQNDAASASEEEEEKPAKPRTKRKGKADDDDEDDVAPKRTRGKKSEDSDEEYGKKKKPAAKSGGKKAGTGYTKLCKLSPELSAVMGEENMARHEVVKKMWQIIKEKNLYDPKNKQFALCNEELLKVFGVKRFRTFGMMKYLKTHFTD